jgi:hypothetical protein
MKKLPTLIADEDLLKALEDVNTATPEKPTEHTVLRFLADFAIEPGNIETNGKLLYKLYYHNTEDPVGSKEFHLILTGYLQYRDMTNGRRYLLNRKAEDLTKKLAQFLAARRAPKKDKNYHYRKHFESFLEAHSLKPGNGNIPAQALYYYYDKWQYEHKFKTRINFRNFVAILKVYFEIKRTSRYWCVVKIDHNFLTNKDLETALEWGSKFNVQKKTKDKIYAKKTK